MSRHRKIFQCGHKGYGQICHRCLQEDVIDDRQKAEKQSWRNSFSFDSFA